MCIFVCHGATKGAIISLKCRVSAIYPGQELVKPFNGLFVAVWNKVFQYGRNQLRMGFEIVILKLRVRATRGPRVIPSTISLQFGILKCAQIGTSEKHFYPIRSGRS